MGKIRAVLFDLDETLLDRDAALRAYAAALHSELGLSSDPLAFVEAFVAGDERGYADKRAMLKALIAEYRIKRNAEWIMRHWSKNAWKELSFNDGAGDLIDRLRKSGYRTGLVTNGSEANQRAKISALGLEGRMDAVAISGELGFAKPAREIFLYAARGLGLEAGDCLFVGDNLEKDAVGAAEAGMKAVLYDKFGERDSRGYPSIRNLNEVLGYL